MSADRNWKPNAPMPQRPAISIVSSWEHATHSGGCGFWIGFGNTLRNGNLKYGPSYSQPPSLNIGSTQRTPSSHTACLSSIFRSNGPSSVMLAPSPMPNSTRPLLTRSRQAIFSAARAGWLVVSWMMPWPRRICFVRWLAAARNTSGCGEWEYSSRKWCSTSQA